MVSACWKELGKKNVHSVDLTDDKKRWENDIHDDYYVVKTIANAIRDADVLIAHNCDKFDLKYLKARMMKHGLDPLPSRILTIDTLKMARQTGRFMSNRLDYLGQFFGVGGKVETEKGLWMKVLKGDTKAVKAMTHYCKGDVDLLEKVYEKLRPYAKSHPNLADTGTLNCPRCNSGNYHIHKHRVYASGLRYPEYQCNDCGGYFNGRTAIKSDDITNIELYGKTEKSLSKM
jgi:DNA polymerase III epsilon subunit-like protein